MGILLPLDVRQPAWDSDYFNLLPVMVSENAQDRVAQIERFVKHVPDSVFSNYMRRTYLMLPEVRWHEKISINPDVASEYRKHLQQHAPWALPPKGPHDPR